MSTQLMRTESGASAVVAGSSLDLWVFWINSHSHAIGQTGSLLHPTLFSILVMVVVAIASPMLDKRTFRIGPVDIFAAVSGALGTVAIWAAGSWQSGWEIAALVAVGFGMGWFSLRYLMGLTLFRLEDVLSITLMAALGYGILGWLTSSLSGYSALLMGVVPPALLPFMMKNAIPKTCEPPTTSYLKGYGRELALGPFACLCGLCFIYSASNILLKVDFGSFAYGESADFGITSLCYLVVLSIFGIAYKCLVIQKKEVRFYTLMKMPVSLLATALVLAGAVGSNPFLQVLTSPCIWIINATYRVLIVETARHAGFSRPLKYVVLGCIGFNLSYYLGRALFYVLSKQIKMESVATLNQTVCIVLLGLLVAIVVLTFRLNGRLANLVFRDINNSAEAVMEAHDVSYESVCRAFARNHGLSERESDVLLLVARGYSKPFIAEKLSISDNTVRTHTRRIYEKVNVHSRRELQEQIEADMAGMSRCD